MIQKDWHHLPAEEVIRLLNSDPNRGLTEKEVQILQQKFGKNQLPEEKPLSKVKIFLDQLKSPLIYILILAGILTLIFKKYTDSIVIFGAVILNTLVGFFQENKASRALRELKKVVKVEAQVIRDGYLRVINAEDLVPGDIFSLKPGDRVPADGRLIEAHHLKINEMALTGEWLPAEKHTQVLKKETPIADQDNMVFMGTVVEEGRGRAVVCAIGLETEIGKVAKMVREAREEKTPLQKKISHFARILLILISLACFLIFLEGVLIGRDLIEIFTVSVALAVAAIPEGLPVALTVILALGMQRILKRKGLVRKLLAAEILGSTSIICTDKTATLTEGKMEVAEIFTYDQKKSTQNLVLKIITICNEAFLENPDQPLEKWIFRGRPTDRALLRAGMQAGFKKEELLKKEPKLDELPFNPVKKYALTLHQKNSQNIFYLVAAPERALQFSKFVEIEGRAEEFDPQKLEKINQKLNQLAGQGYRVVACAYKLSLEKTIKDIKDQFSDFVLVGLVALHDPLRKDVKQSISTCIEAGMRPIIVTGDHKLTAVAIAKELGFEVDSKHAIEGKDLDQLSDDQFKKILPQIQVYARVEPRHKMRIISAWQQRGEVVAMTGDGINDAPALKKADIGVALGSGTDVAKEVSDLVLLTDSFSIIVAAVEEGRIIIDNLRKVVTYLLSTSISEVALIGISLPLGFPLPLLAAQILWINLAEGALPAFALASEPKEKDIMERKPEKKKIPLLISESKALIFIIGLSSTFILLFLYLLLLSQGKDLSYIRTMLFACLTLESFFYIFSCRSLRKNLWQISPISNRFLILSWLLGVLLLVLAIYFPPLQKILKTVPLAFQDWLIFLSFGLAGIILIELTKWYFIAKRKK